MSPRHALLCIKIVIACIWPAAVYAAPLTFQQSIDTVPGIAWFGVCFLSSLGGITALLIKISNQIEDTPDGQPVRRIRKLKTLVAANMFSSWLAGSMAFFLGLHFDVSLFLLAAFVGLSSFGGAHAIQKMYDKIIGKVIKD